MTALTVLPGAFEPMDTPFVLDAGARPRVAHETVELELPPTATVIVAELAALDGLPVGLWAALAVESERARVAVGADAACARRGGSRDRAAGAVSDAPDRYAAALRARASDRPRAGADRDARAPTTRCWRGRSAAEGSMLAWICASLERHPPPASPLGGGGRRAGADARGVGRYACGCR